MNTSDSPLLAAGINIGRGFTKVKTEYDYFQYTSDVSPVVDRRSQSDFGLASESQIVTYEGRTYAVGEDACMSIPPRERKPIFPKWASSLPYLVLRQSVLDRLAREGRDWIVTLGVTLKEYEDVEYRNEVSRLWLGEHETVNGPVRIHAAHVLTEPSGALLYYGTQVVPLEILRMQNLTIIDSGYYTTIGTTHQRLQYVEGSSFEIYSGGALIVEHIAKALRHKYKEKRDVVEVEMAMLGKWPISIDGQTIDMAPLLDEAVNEVGPAIITEMKSGMQRPASSIYLVGGTAMLLRSLYEKAFADEHRVEISDRPQQANAYGLQSFSANQRYQMEKKTAA